MILFKCMVTLSLASLFLSKHSTLEGDHAENAISGEVDYDEAMHGPNKAYRIAGPPVKSFERSDGSFHFENFEDEMNELYLKEKISDERLKESEIEWKKRSLDPNFLKRQKRAPTYGAYEFDTDIKYRTELVSTIGIGTPPQQVPLTFDLNSADTIIPGVASSQTIDKRKLSTILYDSTKSSSSKVHSNAISRTVWVQTAADPRVFQSITIGGTVVEDKVWLPYIVGAISVSFAVVSAIALRQLILHARVGIAPPGLVQQPPDYADNNGEIVAPNLGEYFVSPDNWTPRQAIWERTIAIGVSQGIGFAADDLFYNPDAGSSITDDSRDSSINGDEWYPLRKRSAVASASSEILFGASDPRAYIQPFLPFPVVATPGISQKLIWQLAFGGIQVVQAGKTTTSTALGTARFDLAHRLIYLGAAFVQQFYWGLPNIRLPTTKNPFYSYYCRSPPTVSFNIVDATGTTRLLTLNANDWDSGLAFDSPGWCIGAIQPLPPGSKNQVIGLQFLKTFYGVFKLNAVGQGDTISFATSTRI